ncbi:MAG: hypothetical protein HRT53_21050 [Colwellia sp.]|nr:hypothetical protein [Colwellia sp.]
MNILTRLNKLHHHTFFLGMLAIAVIVGYLFHEGKTLTEVIGITLPSLAILIAIKHFKVQHQLTFFADYTRRYQAIILEFPYEINNLDFDINAKGIEKKNKILKNMQVYFDLCCEEYMLHQTGKIDDVTWNEWLEGINSAFQKKAFQDSWIEVIENNVYFSDEYQTFIGDMIEGKSTKVTKQKLRKSFHVICCAFFVTAIASFSRYLPEVIPYGSFHLEILIYICLVVGLIAIFYAYATKDRKPLTMPKVTD